MRTLFQLPKTLNCSLRTQSLDQLSPEALQQRKTATEEMLVVVIALALLVVVMAIWSGLYALALTSLGMQPAFLDYLAKRRAIIDQLEQRG